MQELWNLLISAESDPNGIPPELVREKVEERNRKMLEIEEKKRQLEKIRQFTSGMSSKPEEPNAAAKAMIAQGIGLSRD